MSLFTLAVIGGIGLGLSITGWIEHNPHLDSMAMDPMDPDDVMISPSNRPAKVLNSSLIYSCFSLYLILIPIVMTETRGPVILMRIARKKRKETRDERYRAKGDVRIFSPCMCFI